jgi:hypothetical protein
MRASSVRASARTDRPASGSSCYSAAIILSPLPSLLGALGPILTDEPECRLLVRSRDPRRDPLVTDETRRLQIFVSPFRHRVELGHGIGDAGFFERPARAEIANLPRAKGGTQLNALMRTEALGSTGIRISFADGSGGWGGALERGDVDALHLHHCVEGASCAGAIGIADQLDELARNPAYSWLQAASPASSDNRL